MASLYLASRSPRRRELLDQIGVGYELLPVDIDETPGTTEHAEDFVRRMAREKAEAGLRARSRTLPVLGADTAIVLDGQVLGKPRDRGHAATMLAALSGREHQVVSGICLADEAGLDCCLAITSVRFARLSGDAIDAYLASGEGDDKAGAYGIQGRGALFVESLHGSYSAVVGLPLFETGRMLAARGLLRGVDHE